MFESHDRSATDPKLRLIKTLHLDRAEQKKHRYAQHAPVNRDCLKILVRAHIQSDVE